MAGDETLEDILPEAFAVVREASKRTLGMRPFDVQVMGGIVLHEGKIAEMKTGEGKTLAATMPVYLNALSGKGVHVVTVNDYLARRDAGWMGEIYEFLGLKVGLIQDAMGFDERKVAYDSDLTYGTNAQFGFDYLRDNIATSTDQLVQRELNFAIVDEVDSILIDEARTPLIISGMPESAADVYYRFAAIVPRLREGEDFEVDEKKSRLPRPRAASRRWRRPSAWRTSTTTSTPTSSTTSTRPSGRTRSSTRTASTSSQRRQVFIVDEFTGRVLEGGGTPRACTRRSRPRRAWRSGRRTRRSPRSRSRLLPAYDKLAGMTGTAATEADEFMHIYKMEVVSIPTQQGHDPGRQ